MLICGVPPPWTALRVFAAAARTGSLRDAAAALSVTPSAVSHQVRALEAWVGAPLFERGVRQVRLTPLGRTLADELGDRFEAMAAAAERARLGAQDTQLRISSLALFTGVWLLPRLDGFRARRPGLAVELDTGNRLADLEAGEADVAIRNAPPPSPALTARKLIDLRAAPVCAPEVAAALQSPADLADMTLIHIATRPSGWPAWLAAAGLPSLTPRASLSFDTVTSALEAAAGGYGIALGMEPFVWDSPWAARLVRPFDGPTVSAGAYAVVTRRADAVRPAVADFTAWLTAELRRDARRLAGRVAEARARSAVTCSEAKSGNSMATATVERVAADVRADGCGGLRGD